jgi:hypothetical protein
MYAGYLELMQSEAEANLNIILPEEAPAAQQQGEQQQGEQQAEGAAPGASAGAAAAEPGGSGQRELVIAIRYSKSCSDASVLWWQEWVAVVPQLRRARAWLPCVDLPTVLASFSISITTAPSHVAVCSGHLRSQSLQLRPGPEGKEHEPLARWVGGWVGVRGCRVGGEDWSDVGREGREASCHACRCSACATAFHMGLRLVMGSPERSMLMLLVPQQQLQLHGCQ